jgi:hypothetical protein
MISWARAACPTYRRLRVVGAVLALGTAGACLPGSGPPLQVYRDDAGAPPPTNLDQDGAATLGDVDLGDPFAITGLAPSHGAWSGGTRTVLRGRGFSSKLRVWIGGTEVASSDLFASDPTRAALVTPAGEPGAADVKIRDDASARERTLPAGFFYDAFVVSPSSGATTGGTRVALAGKGTRWTSGTSVAIDGKPCDAVVVADATHLQCTTPADTVGTKDVLVVNADNTTAQARDAYTYSDSPDGYRGGLSGGALNGSLKVLVFDAWAGKAIPGANVIAGDNIATAVTGRSDSAGVAQLSDARLTGKVTVTIAAKCHQPITFALVPVDTVTAYITPTLDPACAVGDPPSTGNGSGRDGGVLEGELVWSGAPENHRADWHNVPLPVRPTERRAAYVFLASGSPLDSFQLPPKDQATTTDSPGSVGYAYAFSSWPGNATIYALAGIEDRSFTPAHFTAYAMGVVRGAPVYPGAKTTGVDIPMTTTLDHEVTLAPSPPAPGPRGPDRFYGQLAVTVGTNLFAILPTGTASTLLPLGGNVRFEGVPALDATLAGEAYTVTAAAVTGPSLGIPASIVTRINTTDSSSPVAVAGFLGVPWLGEPASGTWSGTHVRVAPSGTFDLLRIDVVSGGGLVTWMILAPGGTTAFDLPDLSTLPNGVGLVRGAITSTAYVARINQFDYARLRYGNFSSGAWNAYAIDALTGNF